MVVGGLVVSTLTTLVLTPLVFTFVYELRAKVARRLGLGLETAAAGESAPAA